MQSVDLEEIFCEFCEVVKWSQVENIEVVQMLKIFIDNSGKVFEENANVIV